MIRVGILGCANIARRSLMPAFDKHAQFRIVAIASRTRQTADELSYQYGCRGCDYDELVCSPEVDMVYCPLPTGLHYQWVKKCLKNRKHVLCEKSLTCTQRDSEELVVLARQNDCLLMESFQFRFHAQNLYVKSLLLGNAIGPIRQMVVRFGVPPFPDGVKNIRYVKELGGGALLDNGAYTLKCATYFFGPDVRVLSAMSGGNSNEFGDVDIYGAIMLDAAGVPVQTAYGFDHNYQNGYEIWGRDGRIVTTRAFTARSDFAAPVVLDTALGQEIREFTDDHFSSLLTHVAGRIHERDFKGEYDECLLQARLLADVASKGGIR